MNATQHHIGNNRTSRRTTTTKIAPTVGRVRKVASKTKDCERNTERQAEIRTHSNASDNFLKCRFLPKQEVTTAIENSKTTAKMERDFYHSLSSLAKEYSIIPMQTKDFDFPYNIALSMWDMQNRMKQVNKDWDDFRLIQRDKKTALAKREQYFPGTVLYYIPVVPLFQMLRDKKYKRNAQLLLSVCSYLYHIADIPYYRQEDSYLYWLYEMHKDWAEDDEETENTYTSELRKAEQVGDRMEEKLRNRVNLKLFEQRLSRFEAYTTFDHECWRISCNAFALYTEYPTASIFRNAPIYDYDTDNDDYDREVIGMKKYISFCADASGWLYENLKECINNEFNEYGALEEPTIYKAFGINESPNNNFDFEQGLFTVLDDLCGLLLEYKTVKNEQNY